MSNMSKELLREYIKEQNFTSPNEILNALKICLEMCFKNH